jgi:hypothetical protein
MKRLFTLVVLVATALTVVVTANAAGGGKLKCFADAPATCTLNSATRATIDTSAGGDAGVYLTNGKSTNGAPLASVDFSFTYFCANTTDLSACTGGGAVRWSIPISTDGNSKTTAGYAFLDAADCGNTGSVSTTSATCPVFFGPDTYANWDAFAAANPSYTVSGALPFIITDVQKSNAAIVSNVNVTKA